MTDDGDTKEWVPIRIPESVRTPAKADSRTYGEIMRAGLVFDVDERTSDRFETLRQQTDADDAPMMGPGLFLSALLDTWEAAENGYYDEGESVYGVGDDEPRDTLESALADVGVGLPDDLREQLDRIESAATTTETRTGRIEQTLEGLQ